MEMGVQSDICLKVSQMSLPANVHWICLCLDEDFEGRNAPCRNEGDAALCAANSTLGGGRPSLKDCGQTDAGLLFL
jgi:hypothetical protein